MLLTLLCNILYQKVSTVSRIVKIYLLQKIIGLQDIAVLVSFRDSVNLCTQAESRIFERRH